MTESNFDFVKSRVLIPSGKCPALLKGETVEDVAEWIKEIQKYKRTNEIYEVSVYRYWAYRLYSDHPSLLKEVLENISIVMNSTEDLYSLMKNSC